MGEFAGAAAHGILMGLDAMNMNPIADFARDMGRGAAGLIDDRFGYRNHVITEGKGHASGYSDTLDRVQRGDSFPHRNDGSIFKNREGLLPKNPDGYYREYVHPTQGIRGPGPQRIIMGRGGETYFTPDHYKSFRRIDYDYYRESHFN
ncbi:MAG: hypothetical protein GY710_08885 [Desulfobacteraceae bacterium]|nr:hypothetical protein [Desulfobacteraceae bacterium]